MSTARSPEHPRFFHLTALEELARGRLSQSAFDYVSGGAGDELTLRSNRSAFDRILLQPRVLTDVSRLDTSCVLLGEKLAHPILLAPAAYHCLLHPEGELASARGAGQSGAPLVIASFATKTLEEIARAASAPLWFQLYVQPDRGFTQALVERAVAAGCRAVCVTVDTPVMGVRYREAGFSLPQGMTCPNLEPLRAEAVIASHRPKGRQIYSAVMDAALQWKDVEWLRSIAKVPLLLKGILNPADAERALEHGADGIIVSNHGGRNLDTAPATIEALPRIAERVAGRMPLLLDGGIRRGTDVLKALALGATAVLIARPYLYALALDGAEGVARCVELLRGEFEMAMALCGRTSLAEIDGDVLWQPR